MDLNGYESWVRLAQANIILGNNERACQILIEATDLQPQYWQLWRDLTTVSVACANFDLAAKTYLKALSLNQDYENHKVLSALVSYIVQTPVNSQVRQDTLKLLTKLINLKSKLPLYRCLYALTLAADPTTREKAIPTVTGAIETVLGPFYTWDQDYRETLKVLEQSGVIVDTCVRLSQMLKTTQDGDKCLQIGRNYCRRILEKVDQRHSDFMTLTVRSVLQAEYLSFSRKCKNLNCTLDQIKNY